MIISVVCDQLATKAATFARTNPSNSLSLFELAGVGPLPIERAGDRKSGQRVYSE